MASSAIPAMSFTVLSVALPEGARRTLRTLRVKAMTESGNDAEAAAALLMSWIEADPELADAIQRAAFYWIAIHECREEMRSLRGVLRSVTRPDDRQVNATRRGLERSADRLMDWPMSDGKTALGNAGRPMIEADASRYLRAGKTSMTEGRWLTIVANQLKKPGDTPRSVLSEVKLREYREKAAKSVESL